MFKELKGLEYVLEVLRALHISKSQCDASRISDLIRADGRIKDLSFTYLVKILPRMRKAGLINISDQGYSLAKAIDEIPVSDVLNIFAIPNEGDPLHKMCVEIKNAVSLTSISEFYEF